MAKYLTQEWLDVQRELAQEFPERPGPMARMQYVVTGSPDGDVKYFTVIDDGKIVENQLGEDKKAEFTLEHLRRLGAGAEGRARRATPRSCRGR